MEAPAAPGQGSSPSPGSPQERLRPAGPDQASPFPATPSVMYRSAFAGECEAIALQLKGGGKEEEEEPGRGRRREAPPSRYPSTLEGEALTPLKSWSSSLCDPFQTPDAPRPAHPPAQAAASSSPPPPLPPGTPNRTYDCAEGEADSRATYICEESSGLSFAPGGDTFASGGLPVTDDDDDAPPRRRETFELPPALHEPPAGRPLVTSSPLWVEGSEPAQWSALGLEEEEEEEGNGGGGGGRLGPAPGQKQLSDEMKKPLSKLPRYKRTSGPTQAPASLTRDAGAGGLLTSVGLEPSVCPEDGTRGTRLPVRTVGEKRSKVRVQKRPLEKLADPSVALKEPLPKRPRQVRGLVEKQAGGLLLAAGQLPRAAAATGNGLVAPCLECRRLSVENQRLTVENQQLKAMLDSLRCKAGK